MFPEHKAKGANPLSINLLAEEETEKGETRINELGRKRREGVDWSKGDFGPN